jgi:hypothetical protein
MNVADQFLEIWVFLTNNGLVSVLKQMSVASMTSVKVGKFGEHKKRQEYPAVSASCMTAFHAGDRGSNPLFRPHHQS